MDIYELRTLCNKMNLSCRDTKGRYLPESKLRSLVSQLGGVKPPPLLVEPVHHTYITQIMYNTALVHNPIELIGDQLEHIGYNPHNFSIEINAGAGVGIGAAGVDMAIISYNGYFPEENKQAIIDAITGAFPELIIHAPAPVFYINSDIVGG